MSTISMTALDGSSKQVPSEAVDALRESLRGTLLTSEDDACSEVVTIFNGMHSARPALIARCTGTADVIDVVNFAREHGVLLSVRGGGHNVAGTGLCSGGMTIDMSRRREVRVDPIARTASVGPGTLLGGPRSRNTSVWSGLSCWRRLYHRSRRPDTWRRNGLDASQVRTHDRQPVGSGYGDRGWGVPSSKRDGKS